MRVQVRVVTDTKPIPGLAVTTLQVPYPPRDLDSPAYAEPPLEQVASFLREIGEADGFGSAREIRYRRFRRVWCTEEVKLSTLDPSSLVRIARRSVKSGTVFFSLTLSPATVADLLVKRGYERVSSENPYRGGHFLGGVEGFYDQIVEMLRKQAATICCFSHDGDDVYLYSDSSM